MKGFEEWSVHAANARMLSRVHRHKYGDRICAPGVAVSHTGCPLRKTGAFSVYQIAASAVFSIASPAGSPHSTRRTASRAALLSVCHRLAYAELSPLEISRIKGYLVCRVQHGFQPKSEMFPELCVCHGCIHSCAQAKNIVRPKNLCCQFQPLFTNAGGAVSESSLRSSTSVVESRLEPFREDMHASLATELCHHCFPSVIPVIPPRSIEW